MLNPRLLERIKQARRARRIAQGLADAEELQAAALEREMEFFRDQVNEALDFATGYLLEIEFTRDAHGPLATLTADSKGFALRPGKGEQLLLVDSDSGRVLLQAAAEPQASNGIVCALADCLAVPEDYA